MHPRHAPPKPHEAMVERTAWGETVVDPYRWMRDADDPAVRRHLEAENAHSDAWFEPISELQERLFEEIKARVKETDLSVPVVKDGWSYYGRTVEGSQYGIHCRKSVDDEGRTVDDEQILLDENSEAAASDSDYFELGVFDVSVDHRLLAWGVDREGNERFRIQIRDLESGAELDDVIEQASYGSAWSKDSRHLFYIRVDDAERPFQVWRHEIGTDPATDALVFEEPDERFFVGVGLERDERFIQIALSSAITDEVWLIPADAPRTEPRCVEPRDQGVEYGLAHRRSTFVVLTNLDAQNFRVMVTTDAHPGRANWRQLIPHRQDVMVTGVEVFDEHLVVFERAGGQARASVAQWLEDDRIGPLETLDQPESVSTVWNGANVNSDTTVFRYGYSSMVTPSSVYTVDLATGERNLLKQQEVLGGFESAQYETRREWATAPDGTEIPISIVQSRRRAEILGSDGPGPALLYGYGAYEATIDPTFSSARLSLLDRGFVFAIAHVRGGGAMGRQWYEDGKFEHKSNSFDDLIACGRHLVSTEVTEPPMLGVRGGSAGGLLVGAALNRAPDLFGAVVAEVPFVDVINTMFDPSLPLTVTEWEEWGNPIESERIYRAMREYAPIENVAEADYPPVFATGGLTDPRVGFWEPAKWVATLRNASTSGAPVLLRIEMEAGHGGPTGRYRAWADEARVMAFLVTVLTG